MKETQVRELMNELFERHDVPPLRVEFHPKPLTTKKQITTELGGILTYTEKMYGTFMLNSITDEVWIEFYGLPSANTVRHEFRHYLEWLGKKYIRKRPDS